MRKNLVIIALIVSILVFALGFAKTIMHHPQAKMITRIGLWLLVFSVGWALAELLFSLFRRKENR